MNKKHKSLWLTAGLPGAGKSTYVEEELNINSRDIWVSRDLIRFNLVGEDEKYFSKENQVFRTFIQRAQAALNAPNVDRVFVDATHLNPKSRKKVLNALTIPDHVDVGCLFFDVPVDTCIERNNQRTGRSKVPEDVIRNMAKTLIKPTTDEGFDKIVVIGGENNG